MRANLYLLSTSKVPEMDEGEERLSSIYEYSHMATSIGPLTMKSYSLIMDSLHIQK